MEEEEDAALLQRYIADTAGHGNAEGTARNKQHQKTKTDADDDDDDDEETKADVKPNSKREESDAESNSDSDSERVAVVAPVEEASGPNRWALNLANMIINGIDRVGELFTTVQQQIQFAMQVVDQELVHRHPGRGARRRRVGRWMEDAGPEPRITPMMVHAFGIPRNLSRLHRTTLGTIMEMFPEACPRWIANRLRRGDARTETVVYEMIAEPDCYDRYVSPNQAAINVRRMETASDRTKFNPAVFLKQVPNPELTFNHINPVSNIKPFPYVDLALTAMQNEFRNIRLDYIKASLAKTNYHFYPAYKQMKKMIASATIRQREDRPFMQQPKKRKYRIPWPPGIDEGFVNEYRFALFEDVVQQYRKDVRDARQRRLDEACKNGELSECACCLQACTPADLVTCPRDHPFCKDCVKTTVEPKIHQGVNKLACLGQDCSEFYATNALNQVLEPKVFDRLVTNIQQKELKDEADDDLKECPFCQFAMLIEDEDETLFRCPNPDCRLISCLQCRQVNHRPLKCEDVQQSETKMRTHIEEQIAESLIKSCMRCKRPIVKTDGCDHITCLCGYQFCYRCGGMWYDPNGTPKDHTLCALNRINDPLQAGMLAKEIFLARHPQLRNIANQPNPVNLVENNNINLNMIGQAMLGGLARPPGFMFRGHRRRRRRVNPRRTKRAQRLVAQRATREQRCRLRAWKRAHPLETVSRRKRHRKHKSNSSSPTGSASSSSAHSHTSHDTSSSSNDE